MAARRRGVARPVHVVALSGSLQTGSANTALLRALAAEASDDVHVEMWQGLGALPHFRPDADPHATVDSLQATIGAADAVLIATPEYAGGMPGSLKNALDWLVGSGGLYEKPVVIVSAAPALERGHNARRWVEEVTRMQGGVVRDSFTVHVATADGPEQIARHARDVLPRLVAALAPTSVP
jgi:chromate reductase, NAD(P)H dehydrogenase (quinone)